MLQRIIFALTLIWIVICPHRTQGASKIALVVGVAKYPASSGWQELSSENDIRLVRSALISQGFDSTEIATLKNELATKDGIIQAFRQYLIHKAQPGGVAFFHFSGHGQQVTDENQDEIDGFDEAIVPYDSPFYFRKGIYEGNRLIRDEELGLLLTELRKKLGPQGHVLVIIDACHSGTGTRGFGLARGSAVKMASPTYISANKKKMPDGNHLAGPEEASNLELAPMIALFASGPNQLNYEVQTDLGEQSGSMSYAFSKVFSTLEKGTSYQGLFDRIRLEMAALTPWQSPQIEGDLNRLVIGGKITGLPKYYEVKEVIGKIGFINAGSLAGIYPKTTLAFFPIDTRNVESSQPLATGEVIDVKPLSAQVRLENLQTEARKLKGTWAFVQLQNYGHLQVKLQVNGKEKDFSKGFYRKLVEMSAIQLVETEPDLLLEKGVNSNGKKKWSLYSREGQLIWQADRHNEDELEQNILSYAQARFLRNLSMENKYIDVRMEMIPVIVDRRDTNRVLRKLNIADKTGVDGIIRFRERDKFLLQISNNGEKPAYYSILDIGPDNHIGVIIPHPYREKKQVDFLILPGQTQILEDYVWSIARPFGNEVFKLIATEGPINLTEIIVNQGEQSRSKPFNNPFEMLLNATYQQDKQLKRGATPSVPSNSAHIHSMIFQVIE